MLRLMCAYTKSSNLDISAAASVCTNNGECGHTENWDVCLGLVLRRLHRVSFMAFCSYC